MTAPSPGDHVTIYTSDGKFTQGSVVAKVTVGDLRSYDVRVGVTILTTPASRVVDDPSYQPPVTNPRKTA